MFCDEFYVLNFQYLSGIMHFCISDFSDCSDTYKYAKNFTPMTRSAKRKWRSITFENAFIMKFYRHSLSVAPDRIICPSLLGSLSPRLCLSVCPAIKTYTSVTMRF